MRQYPGGYTDTMKAKEFEALQTELKTAPRDAAPKKKETRPKQANRKLKFSFKEQKEYETIDDDIEALEKRLEEIDQGITAAADDYKKLQELTDMRSAVESELEEKTERWVYLNELAEKIASQ